MCRQTYRKPRSSRLRAPRRRQSCAACVLRAQLRSPDRAMRHALISDIHANLPALEAVLADIAGRANVDATYHLGDLVGYGPWPNETIHRLRQSGIPGAAGNYDSHAAAVKNPGGCRNEAARQEELSHLSFAWT